MALPLSRNTDYSSDSPVRSLDLNDLQDAVANGSHGEVVDIINGTGLRFASGVAASGSGWAQWSSAASAFWTPTLRTGQRVTGLLLRAWGDASADFTIGVYVVSPAAALTQICPGAVTAAITNPPASWADYAIDLTDTTLAAGESLLIEIAGSATGLRVLNAQLTNHKPIP